MKILQVIDRMMRSGGAEKFALDLTVALSKIDGVDVEVLSISPPENEDFVNILVGQGIKHHVLSDRLYSLSNAFLLKNYIDNGNYDIIHVHLFPALYYASFARILSRKHFKLIYTEHSTTNKRRNRLIFRLTDRLVYGRYNSIVGISDKVKDNLDRHLSRNDVKIINNGIDIDAIQNSMPSNLRGCENIPSDVTIVTMVSRIADGKDYKTLIKAIEHLPDCFHLVFVGDGPLMPDLKDCVHKSEAANRIHMLGLRTDVFGILKTSDIIVLSTHHEGFSIAMLEAMASKKPFVASAVEGIKDLVDGTAELFEYQNEKELASILFALYKDKKRYSCVADRCFRFAQRYDIRNVAEKYLSVYNQMVQS